MTKTISRFILNTPTYGARELKDQINNSTIKGFIYALSGFTFAFISFISINTFMPEPVVYKAPIAEKGITIIDIFDLTAKTEPVTIESTAGIPQTVFIEGTFERTGIPVPVPNLDMAVEGNFATTDNIGISAATLGTSDGIDTDIKEEISSTNTPIAINIPDGIDSEVGGFDYTSVETLPFVDLKELASHVIYPDIAIRAKAEGTVFVKVLISKTGAVLSVIIDDSDHMMLDKAAIEAVKKASFTPAIQNNTPVNCWVIVPIEFKLH